MGCFDRAKKAVENSQKQGCESDSFVKKVFKAYEQQANLADDELRKKQARERSEK